MTPVVRGGGEAVEEEDVLGGGGLGRDVDVGVGERAGGGVG